MNGKYPKWATLIARIKPIILDNMTLLNDNLKKRISIKEHKKTIATIDRKTKINEPE